MARAANNVGGRHSARKAAALHTNEESLDFRFRLQHNSMHRRLACAHSRARFTSPKVPGPVLFLRPISCSVHGLIALPPYMIGAIWRILPRGHQPFGNIARKSKTSAPPRQGKNGNPQSSPACSLGECGPGLITKRPPEIPTANQGAIFLLQ